MSAGAGSGKTGVLVERFLQIIREGIDAPAESGKRTGVADILVITFTEKATKEMKGRIVDALNHAGLREERRQVETAYISTIHGFCSRLLKENPFEAGVDPEFKVVDETEARRIARSAFEAVIERAYASNDEEITELVAAVQDQQVFGTDGQDPLAALESSVRSVLGSLRGAGWRQEALALELAEGNDATAHRIREPIRVLINQICAEVKAAAEALSLLRTGVLGAMEAARRDVLTYSADLDEITLRPSWDTISTALNVMRELAKAAARGSRIRAYDRPGVTAESTAQQFMARIQIATDAAKGLYGLESEREAEAEVLCYRLLRLVSAVWESYGAMKRAEGVLDNEDLQSEAVHLLRSSPGVLRRCRRKFQHIMVDEFQDTNPLQMELVNLLHDPKPHADSESNCLFVVGDVQQSIYGFRNADATIFQGIEREYRQSNRGAHVTLADNFRARPEILRFVNYLFRQIWRDNSDSFTPLTPGAAYAEKASPSIEFLVTRDSGRPNYVASEARALARRIRQMVSRREIRFTDCNHPRFGEAAQYSDIAILLRSLTDIEKYERIFTEEGLPYFVVGGGRGYYARTEIRDIMNVLTVLDTPLDDVALLAALRSPMVGLDTSTLYSLARFARNERKGAPIYPQIGPFVESGQAPPDQMAALAKFHGMAEALREIEDRESVGRLLDMILEQTGYDARLLYRKSGKRRLANVRKLLQMASAASNRGVADFIRRLREIEKVSDREGDAPTEEEASDVTRIMTIHKAKGLEFPVVFVADLGRSLAHPDNSLFTCDPKSLSVGCKLGEYHTAPYRSITQARKTREREEQNRLLYVALTRAREYLVLCGATQGRPSDTWATMVFGHMAITQPDNIEIRTAPGEVGIRLTPMEALT